MNKTFQTVGRAHPGRSAFDLSYSKVFPADMGILYPVTHDEMVPGDVFKISNEMVIRMMPLVSPVLHEINVFVHYFFIPYRLLSTDTFDWEDFITGGVDGDDASVLPRWEPTDTAVGSLWDYFGFPPTIDPDGAYPLQFILNAYNLVWNQYYMDLTLQTEVALDDENLLRRCWEKDYFTSALPWQQRGTAPALPISGTTSAVWDSASFTTGSPATMGVNNASTPDAKMYGNNANAVANMELFWNDNEVDLSVASTFDIADLRLAFQIQRWMERNARCGARYVEFLRAHYGVAPDDLRLQRAHYIGGSMAPVIVSEVLQTSESATTPQGTLAGHGITVGQEFIGSYRAEEFGIILGLLSIMPKTMYSQGINRQWLRRTRYDFYSPEFANLSEQAIEQAEIYATAVDSENTGIFGYQGRYDEMRYKPNIICGLMHTDFAHWHLGRIFTGAPALNDSFLQCNPSKRIFAVTDEPGFVVSFGNRIKGIRPLPISSAPGLIDHN